MSIRDKLAGLFAGKNRQETLDALTRENEEYRPLEKLPEGRTIARLRQARKQHAVNAIGGDAEAREQMRRIDDEIETHLLRARELRDAIGEATLALEQERQAARVREHAEKPARVAAAIAKRLAAVESIDKAAKALGEAMQDAQTASKEIIAVLGTGEARRVYGPAAWQERLAIALGRHMPALGIPNPAVGERAQRTLLDLEQEVALSVARIYPTSADAEHAKALIEANGEKTAAVPRPGGGFMLVGLDSVFADRALAQRIVDVAERRGKTLAVHPHQGAFVVIDLELCGEAA